MSNVTMKQGKVATRGEKTIMSENVETLAFYRNMIAVFVILPIVIQVALYFDTLTNTFYIMHSITTVLFFCSWKFMSFMAVVRRGPRGEVIDCGTDLNMQNGMAEHIKDIILLTGGVQLLAMFSEWLWLLLLLAPARGFYLFWVHVAAPWFFAPAPEEEELSDKKQRRMDRKQTKFKRA